MTVAKRVLVTGADGFIGSHLTEYLVRSGYEVTAMVMYNSMNDWGWLDHCVADVKGHFGVIAGDVRDPFFVSKSMRGQDLVLHLAALIAIPFSYIAPEAYVETNIKGTLNVLQAARECEVSRLIHTSTSEVYGTAQSVPISESHPLNGQSPYAATKIAADQLANSFYASYGLPVSIVRPFNTFGPRQSNRAVIPTVITQIASGASEIKLGNISPTRDFNYVKDTVAGFVAALESDVGLGQVVNLGSGYEISIGEVVAVISNIMKADVTIVQDGARIRPENSEVDRLVADSRKAEDLFNWSSIYSGRNGLELSLRETVDWFKNPINLSRYKPSVYNV